MNSAKFLYHLRVNSGERINLISREVDRFTSTFSNLSVMIISSISIIIFIGSLFLMDLSLVLIIIILLIIFHFFFRPIFSITKKYSFISTEKVAIFRNCLLNLFITFLTLNQLTELVR